MEFCVSVANGGHLFHWLPQLAEAVTRKLELLSLRSSRSTIGQC